MGKLHPRPQPLAVAWIGFTVAAADDLELEELRTDLGYGYAVSLQVGRLAEPGRQVAELAHVAHLAEDPAADLAALAVMQESHAGSHSLAVVAIGYAVATADGLVMLGACFRPRQAYPFAFGAIANLGRHFAEHAFAARMAAIVGARVLTGTEVVEANPCLQECTFVRIGYAVTAAERQVVVRAIIRDRYADALVGGVVTMTG
jgi:hypothetical protein